MGVINVREGITTRRYVARKGGGFGSVTPDGSTFELTPTGSRVLGQDGSMVTFRPDGRLDQLRDAGGNTITAGYTGSLMTSLTHSDGDRVTLAYDLNGHVARLTMPDGLVSTFTYDASRSHLIAANGPNGVSTYDYLSSFPTQDGALAKVTLANNTHSTFSFDGKGRVIQLTGDNGWANSPTVTRPRAATRSPTPSATPPPS